MELVKGHDRPEEEEREVEVVLEEVEDGVDALFPLRALERKAHAAHDGEAAPSVEEDILEIKSSGYKPALHEKQRVTTRNAVSLLCSLALRRTSLLGAAGKAPNHALTPVVPGANELFEGEN